MASFGYRSGFANGNKYGVNGATSPLNGNNTPTPFGSSSMGGYGSGLAAAASVSSPGQTRQSAADRMSTASTDLEKRIHETLARHGLDTVDQPRSKRNSVSFEPTTPTPSSYGRYVMETPTIAPAVQPEPVKFTVKEPTPEVESYTSRYTLQIVLLSTV